MSERYLVDENKNLVAYSEPSLVSKCKVVVVQATASGYVRNFPITSDLIDCEYVCFLASFSSNSRVDFYINWDDENKYTGTYFMKYITSNIRDFFSDVGANQMKNDKWFMIQGSNMSGSTYVSAVNEQSGYNFAYCLFQFMRAS